MDDNITFTYKFQLKSFEEKIIMPKMESERKNNDNVVKFPKQEKNKKI